MIFPDIEPQIWAEKHGLQMLVVSCQECGEPIKTITPYVEKGIVGFIARECPACKQTKAVPRSMKFTDGREL